MPRPRKVYRTFRDFAYKGKTLSDLTIPEVQECMSDPELSFKQWSALRDHYCERVGIGSSQDFFEGVVLEAEPVATLPAPSPKKAEPKLVEVNGEMVDPASLTSLQRTTLFGNDNKISGGAMSQAEYRKFMSEVKG